MLFPRGSANEKKKGETHLFEHIICKKWKHTLGFTREDYAFFALIGNSDEDSLIRNLKSLKVSKSELENIKDVVLNEILRNQSNEEELFWKEVWEKTDYEYSPLGTYNDIFTIDINDIERIKYSVLANPIYFYKKRLIVKNKNKEKKELMNNDKIFKKDIKINKKKFVCYFFSKCPEELFILKEIMNLMFSNKLIYISEKKHMSVVIIKTGVEFPTMAEIDRYYYKALEEVIRKIKLIKDDFISHVMNEFESQLFHDIIWELRVNFLLQTTKLKIRNFVNKLEKL
ncbi:MAG: hypothetical protein GF317_15075 [Candidatus Lokiarchaeota archaeon]|nr:hypothetical protein [Candidatus Lokiarchaeota archaeon]